MRAPAWARRRRRAALQKTSLRPTRGPRWRAARCRRRSGVECSVRMDADGRSLGEILGFGDELTRPNHSSGLGTHRGGGEGPRLRAGDDPEGHAHLRAAARALRRLVSACARGDCSRRVNAGVAPTIRCASTGGDPPSCSHFGGTSRRLQGTGGCPSLAVVTPGRAAVPGVGITHGVHLRFLVRGGRVSRPAEVMPAALESRPPCSISARR